MVFNSFTFLFFFAAFFFLYWFVFNKNKKNQNIILLIGNYVFYAWADWRFLSFLIGVSLLNFILGLYIEKETKYKRLLVYIGLIQGIGGLAFFKYYNFFIDSFNELFHSLNLNTNLKTLDIIIPLGISFFTFRTISYILDVDKGKMEATKDWVVFFNYVSFFPSVLSGPIDKARTFVPQLEKKRVFDYEMANDGMLQILWGLFKKVVIADNCAVITNQIFSDYQSLPASSLVLGAFLYTIQLYADFSGYSDMAIGVSKLLGLKVSKNFDYPFFSQNIAEFWRKWHISLTAWLTEYIFTPLSITFRDLNKLGLILAIVINFTIIGIWHGANWTYVLFGFLHGCYFIPLILKGTMNKKRKIAKDKLLPSVNESMNMLLTFILVMFTFILFKSENVVQAYHLYRKICSLSVFSIPTVSEKVLLMKTILLIIIMIIAEWIQREKDHVLQLNGRGRTLKVIVVYSIIFSIIFLSASVSNQFIYFKF